MSGQPPGFYAYKLAFQVSPIVLTGGIAENIPGGMLPIVALTQSVSFTLGLLMGTLNPSLDNFFANFDPMAGSTLISQKIGTYPFANQTVAANAVISDPQNVSMMMTVPARAGTAGVATKLATMMALQAALSQHTNRGGTYTVVTPSYFFTNCILLRMMDVTPGNMKQRQVQWQLDFVQPLLTLAQAASAQNSLMSKITAGTPIDGQPAWSGLNSTVGQPPSLAATSLIPAASNTPSSGAAQSLMPLT